MEESWLRLFKSGVSQPECCGHLEGTAHGDNTPGPRTLNDSVLYRHCDKHDKRKRERKKEGREEKRGEKIPSCISNLSRLIENQQSKLMRFFMALLEPHTERVVLGHSGSADSASH